MTLFKTALKNLKRSPVMNAISLLQLVAVFLVAAVMTSTLSIRLRSYLPIKDLLESKGFHASFDKRIGAAKIGAISMNDSFFSIDELNTYTNAKNVIYLKSVEAIEYNGMSGSVVPTILFYDNELLKRCRPALKSGRWVSENSDELEFVVTDNNDCGWKVGDTLELEVPQVGRSRWITARVVGIIEDDVDIFGYNRPRLTDDTFRYLYNTHNSQYEEHPGKPSIISSAEAAARIFPELETRIDSAFFIYDYDTPDELVKEKIRIVGRYGSKVTLELETLNANSKAYLRSELLKLLPIVIMLLILVVVSSVSVSAIATRRRLKDYAKYYVLGLQWKQCAVVNLLQSLITGAAALIITIAALFIVSLTPLSQTITIITNSWLVFALLGIFALYLVFSMIMPLLMLRSTTPKALLQAE